MQRTVKVVIVAPRSYTNNVKWRLSLALDVVANLVSGGCCYNYGVRKSEAFHGIVTMTSSDKLALCVFDRNNIPKLLIGSVTLSPPVVVAFCADGSIQLLYTTREAPSVDSLDHGPNLLEMME